MKRFSLKKSKRLFAINRFTPYHNIANYKMITPDDNNADSSKS